MSKIIVSEGKTTSEAIEKGLKELNMNYIQQDDFLIIIVFIKNI